MAAIFFANEEGNWTNSVGTPIEPSTIEMGIVYNTQVSTSPLSGDVKTLELPGARWRVRMSFNDLEPEETRPLLAWLSDLRGSAGRFLVYDFSHAIPRGGTISANYSVTTRSTITLSSVTGGGLQVGDLFSIRPAGSTVPELKMVTQIMSANVYRFEPIARRLPAAYIGGVFGIRTTAYAHMMLTSDDQSFHATAEKGLISNITIEAIEVFG